MTSLLIGLCAAVFFISPPALLAGKWLWPNKLPWWLLVSVVAISSWLLLVLGDHLVQVRDAECTSQVVGNTIVGCPIMEYSYSYNRELGWLKGLIYLLPWVAVFGAAKALHSRRQWPGGAPPNKSLERTREG
jgi:hypothetical protein